MSDKLPAEYMEYVTAYGMFSCGERPYDMLSYLKQGEEKIRIVKTLAVSDVKNNKPLRTQEEIMSFIEGKTRSNVDAVKTPAGSARRKVKV